MIDAVRARAADRSIFAEAGSLVRRGGFLVVCAAGAQTVSNLVFHAVSSRAVGPADYGALAALLAIMVAAAAPLASVQLAVGRSVLEAGPKVDERTILVRAFRASLAIAVVGIAVAPMIRSFLRLPDLILALAVGPYAALALMGAVGRGVLTGRRRVGALAGSLVVAAAVRLVLGVTLVGRFGVTGAIAATLAGELAGTAVVLGPLIRRRGSIPARLNSRDIGVTIFAIAGLWLFASGDVLLARRFLDAVESGLYVAASNAARALLIVPHALLIVALPHFVRARRARHIPDRHVTLLGTLGVVGILTGAGGAAMVIVGSWGLRVLYGDDYSAAAPLLWPVVGATVAIALSVVCVHRDIARRSAGAYLPWLGLAFGALLIARFHASGMQIAQMTLIVSVAYAIVSVALAIRSGARTVSRAAVVGDLYAPGGPSVELSIVVPFLDPTGRAAQNVLRLVEILAQCTGSFEVIAVSDGSPTDAFRPLIDPSKDGRLRLLCLPHNCGKGSAVRFGLSQARGRYVGFVDGDGDIPFTQVHAYVEAMRAFSPDILYGSRQNQLSIAPRSRVRSVASAGFRSLIRTVITLRVDDTQCGLKLLDREVAKAVLPWLSASGFSFDVEIFAVAHRLGYKRFLDAPIEVLGRSGSTMRGRTVLWMMLDVLKIVRRVRHIPTIRRDRFDATSAPLATDLRDAVGTGRLRPLRILVLSWRDPSHPSAGGSEVYLSEIASRWVEWGHNVTWFSAAVEGSASDEVSDGVRFVRRGNRFTVYGAAKRFWAEQDPSNYDLVFDVVNTRPFGAARYVKGVPVVALIHQVARQVWFYEMAWPAALIGAFLLEPWWLLRYRDVPTLTVSESSRRSLAGYGLRRLRIVPEGVNSSTLAGLPPKAERPTIVFCARLVRSKRPEHALQAFALIREQLTDAELIMIGTGPMAGRLRKNAPEGVRFLGHVSDAVRSDFMARAHAIVATSVREGWGLVVSEAASVGTRAVAYDVDGLRDSVAAAGGVLCDPNPGALADALVTVLPRWRTRSSVVDRHGGALSWSAVAAEVLAAAVFDADVVTAPPSSVRHAERPTTVKALRPADAAGTGTL